jgi:N-acetylneuraminate lyase
VLTPFSAKGGLDLDLFARHVERLYGAGVNGIYVGGNAGEWYAMTLEERKLLAETAIALSRKRGRTVIHVGALRLEDSIHLARHAERAGADAISSLPPYISNWSLEEVRGWFEQVSQVSDLPFFIYYFPRLTGGAIGEPFFDAMRTLPRVTGYKFTDLNLFDLGVLLETGCTVLNGHDPNLQVSLELGAVGGIGSFYNVAPATVTFIHKAARAGDAACAARHQAQLNRLIRTVRSYRLIPALKFISELQGFPQGEMRVPTMPLSADERRSLEDGLTGILCKL